MRCDAATVESLGDDVLTERVLSVDQTSYLLGVSDQTLKAWRRKGFGPPVIALSAGRIGYRIKDIRAWLDQLARESSLLTPEVRAAAQRAVVQFVDAMSKGDHAQADAILPVNAANAVAVAVRRVYSPRCAATTASAVQPHDSYQRRQPPTARRWCHRLAQLDLGQRPTQAHQRRMHRTGRTVRRHGGQGHRDGESSVPRMQVPDRVPGLGQPRARARGRLWR